MSASPTNIFSQHRCKEPDILWKAITQASSDRPVKHVASKSSGKPFGHGICFELAGLAKAVPVNSLIRVASCILLPGNTSNSKVASRISFKISVPRCSIDGKRFKLTAVPRMRCFLEICHGRRCSPLQARIPLWSSAETTDSRSVQSLRTVGADAETLRQMWHYAVGHPGE